MLPLSKPAVTRGVCGLCVFLVFSAISLRMKFNIFFKEKVKVLLLLPSALAGHVMIPEVAQSVLISWVKWIATLHFEL